MEERKLATDAEIDAAISAAGITIPAAMKPSIRDGCRALKQLARELAVRNVS